MTAVRPETLLRAGALALLAAVAAAGVVQAFGSLDLASWLHWAPACAFRAWTGVACPGCGMAHALVAIGQGDFSGAFAANPAAALVIAIAACAALQPRWLDGPRAARGAWLALALLLPAWLYRIGVAVGA